MNTQCKESELGKIVKQLRIKLYDMIAAFH
jgi:hypothetical protein